MSGQRKLQQEMDKVFKKIIEGLEIFDTLYERHENASNSSQKDKLENDLKKEIKKLQRFREQVKNWQASNEIKDKNQLLEHRKLVEVAMEKYKVVEKGSKTKAYSDQSLAAIEQPEIENEAVEFVRQSLDKLQQQIESIEAEIEKLQPQKKGKKNFHNEELKKELEEFLSNHKWHIGKLEIILRLLQNEVLSVDEVMLISEDISYYLEENRSPDFMFDDTIYDELDLEADQGIINEIQLIDSIHNDTSIPESSTVPETISPPKSRSAIIQQNDSNLNSRSNSQNFQQAQHKQEKPPVISQQPFLIGTSSTTSEPTFTTLKPAPVPTLHSEIKWSSLVNEVKKKDTSPTPVQMSEKDAIQSKSGSPQDKILREDDTINDNALNAVSVLETLKKQKPKEILVETKPSQSTPSNHQQLRSSVPEAIHQNLLPSPAPYSHQRSDILNKNLDLKSDQSEESSQIFGNSDDVTAIENFRLLPPGVQSFVISIALNRGNPNKLYDPFKSLNYTPNGTYPSGSKSEKLFQSWNRINKLSDFDEILKTRNSEELFYGYYYGRSSEERNSCYNILIKSDWKQTKAKDVWYLTKKLLSTGDNWIMGNFTIFNVDTWATSEKLNFKIENNEI